MLRKKKFFKLLPRAKTIFYSCQLERKQKKYAIKKKKTLMNWTRKIWTFFDTLCPPNPPLDILRAPPGFWLPPPQKSWVTKFPPTYHMPAKGQSVFSTAFYLNISLKSFHFQISLSSLGFLSPPPPILFPFFRKKSLYAGVPTVEPLF